MQIYVQSNTAQESYANICTLCVMHRECVKSGFWILLCEEAKINQVFENQHLNWSNHTKKLFPRLAGQLQMSTRAAQCAHIFSSTNRQRGRDQRSGTWSSSKFSGRLPTLQNVLHGALNVPQYPTMCTKYPQCDPPYACSHLSRIL